MSNLTESLSVLIDIPGALAASVVDLNSGMVLAQTGLSSGLEFASAGHAEIVRMELRTIQELKLDDQLDDVLITLNKQYHIICLVKNNPDLFLYCILDKAKANLALARHRLKEVESRLVI